MSKLARYEIQCDVLRARGWQIFSVLAEDEEDALERFANGESAFVDEEIEVTDIGNPEILSYAEEEDISE